MSPNNAPMISRAFLAITKRNYHVVEKSTQHHSIRSIESFADSSPLYSHIIRNNHLLQENNQLLTNLNQQIGKNSQLYGKIAELHKSLQVIITAANERYDAAP
jgi:hypothetical protein